MEENPKKPTENIVRFTVDTVDGPIERDIDLDSLSLSELSQLVLVAPNLKEYYGTRLIKELQD